MKAVTQILREKAVTVTPQRVAVMEYLLRHPDHPSVDDVYRGVKKRFRFISRATVYNTLKAFMQAGVLQEVLVEQEKTRVDVNVTQHHHFKCVECGRIEDLPYALLTADQVAGRLSGYQVQGVHMVIEGRCKTCR